MKWDGLSTGENLVENGEIFRKHKFFNSSILEPEHNKQFQVPQIESLEIETPH